MAAAKGAERRGWRFRIAARMLASVFTCAFSSACPQPAGQDDADSEQATDTTAAPDECETRQQRPDESLAGATDVQALCDPEQGVVAFHRPSDAACDTAPAPIDACKSSGGECESDADCSALAPGGRCGAFDGLGGACACVLPCATDDDCAADRACLCRSAVFVDGHAQTIVSHTGCWPASCRTDDDCAADGQCGMTNPGRTCVQTPRIACRGPADACQSDLDCEVDPGVYAACGMKGDAWACVEEVCG